jgi:hypothetical protein
MTEIKENRNPLTMKEKINYFLSIMDVFNERFYNITYYMTMKNELPKSQDSLVKEQEQLDKIILKIKNVDNNTKREIPLKRLINLTKEKEKIESNIRYTEGAINEIVNFLINSGIKDEEFVHFTDSYIALDNLAYELKLK